MTTKKPVNESRSLEAKIDIAAPVEAVWKALADAQEITRWFCMDCRVEPGAGGSIWMSWGKEWEMGGRIEVWEPNRHLRTTAVHAPPQPLSGEGEFMSQASKPSEDASPQEGVEISVDYFLEGSGGRTTLRLVHSGFGKGKEWDDEFNGTVLGWQLELRSLRHYLERHRGTPRRPVWVRRGFSMTLPEAWSRLWGEGGLRGGPGLDSAREGDACEFRTASGDLVRGRVLVSDPPEGFEATMENLNGSIFRAMLMEYYGRREASLWLSTWGVPESDVAALEGRFKDLLARVLP